MKIIQDQKLAVVGAGPGGLTLARLLQMRGADVTVYERDTGRAARHQGATLDLHDDSGLKALRAAGLMDAFHANYRPGADRLVIMDQHAQVILEEFSSANLDVARPEIDRGPLRDLLIDSLAAGTVIWGSQLTSLVRANGQVRLQFSDGTSTSADLVVAADGANSKVRPYLTPIRPLYSGVTVVEGMVDDSATATPELHRLLNQGKICALGDGKSLFVISKGNGSLSFYTGHRAAEAWARTCGIDFTSRSRVLHWFKGEFSGWSEQWDALFENAQPCFVPRPQYYFPLDQTWEAKPDLTLLGDAAHVMPPYAGEGVNMAMLDALELAENLLDGAFSDTRSAIADYEGKMRARTSEVTRVTLEQTESFHALSALADITRFFAAHARQNSPV